MQRAQMWSRPLKWILAESVPRVSGLTPAGTKSPEKQPVGKQRKRRRGVVRRRRKRGGG